MCCHFQLKITRVTRRVLARDPSTRPLDGYVRKWTGKKEENKKLKLKLKLKKLKKIWQVCMGF